MLFLFGHLDYNRPMRASVLVFGGVSFRQHILRRAFQSPDVSSLPPYATVHSAVIGEFDEVADANKDLSRVRADPLKAVTH